MADVKSLLFLPEEGARCFTLQVGGLNDYGSIRMRLDLSLQSPTCPDEAVPTLNVNAGTEGQVQDGWEACLRAG